VKGRLREQCIERLLKMPAEIADAEDRVVQCVAELTTAKEALEDAEARLLLSGEIDGKNAEARRAQLRERTTAEREAVRKAEQALAQAKAELAKAQVRLRALEAIAALVRGEKTA